MKKKKNLWSGVSMLIVAVLAVTAFIRGKTQIVLFIIHRYIIYVTSVKN